MCIRDSLNPDDFYILASKEQVVVPPQFAAEMVPYDTLVGEFGSIMQGSSILVLGGLEHLRRPLAARGRS